MAAKKKASAVKDPPPQSGLHDGSMASADSGEPAPLSPSEWQLRTFDSAVQLFRGQKFQEAKAVFEQIVTGPQKEISHNARLHINMCDRRLEKPALTFETLDDHYNYAIERLNARDIALARKHLDCALQMLDKSADTAPDHLYYAMALCAGLSGDTDQAFENLKQAIDLNPRNRAVARQDSDFAPIAQQPRIQQLLYPEKQIGPF